MSWKQEHGPIDLRLLNRMRTLLSLVLFFGLLIVLISVHRTYSGFRGGGGEAIGGHTAGPSNLGDIEGFRLNEADLVYTKKREAFRGGGGEAIGGRTAGPNNIGDLGSSAEFFTEQESKRRDQMMEAFENLDAPGPVVGHEETGGLDGPAPATLTEPRKPYNLLEQLPPAPRGSISCLNAACCAETDFETRTNLTGNYLQRTNNYKREFPDNCTGPLHELTLAFYKPEILRKN